MHATQGRVLVHHGIKGQKWGVRRYQNEDGTLTSAGKARTQTKINSKSTTKKLIKGFAIGAGIGLTAAGIAVAIKKGKNYTNKKTSTPVSELYKQMRLGKNESLSSLSKELLGFEPLPGGTPFTIKTINSKGQWAEQILRTPIKSMLEGK